MRPFMAGAQAICLANRPRACPRRLPLKPGILNDNPCAAGGLQRWDSTAGSVHIPGRPAPFRQVHCAAPLCESPVPGSDETCLTFNGSFMWAINLAPYIPSKDGGAAMRTSKPDRTPIEDAWTCPFCQQTVRLGAYGFCTSAEFREHCLLREHIVDDECVAFRDPRKARELLMDRD